jgi:hypothetical protein
MESIPTLAGNLIYGLLGSILIFLERTTNKALKPISWTLSK